MFATRPRRTLGLLVPAALVAALVGCGSATPQRDASAGTALQVGGVSYDVQISRELNPDSASDSPLFAGVPAAGRNLPPDQVWLGVFLQAQNDSGSMRRTTSSITVADTDNHVFRPVALPGGNDSAYRAEPLAPGDTEPNADSPAGTSPEQGSVLIFHVPLDYFTSNRPLELRIADHGRLGTVQLDL